MRNNVSEHVTSSKIPRSGDVYTKVLCPIFFGGGWCLTLNISTSLHRPHYGPGVDSGSNRNEYQEYFLGLKAAGA
jgi:hypothetical protein